MAAGGARYLRFLLFAGFCIVILYLVSQSSYSGAYDIPNNPLPNNPLANNPLPDHGVTDGVDRSAENSAAQEPSAEKLQQQQQQKQQEQLQEQQKAPAVGESYDPAQYPMAMSPNDPGWGELLGTAPGPRMNATFVTLARNNDVWDIAKSIREVEDRFNRRYNYDWVFLNDKPFDETFKKVTSSLVSGNTHYGEIAEEHWSFPEWIDQEKAAKVRQDMKERKIIYGDSISYRHMCRFESGFFFRQPHMMNYEYYWRVEPNVKLFCDLHYDPFRFMAENKKKYSFTLSLYEYIDTIPTLWESTKKFIKNHPEHIVEDNSMGFLSDDGGETYNRCHFWSNFEIGSLTWLRSKQYIDFFESLDQDGGFFYERWGDAPVHSIAAGLMLKKDEIHFFDDIAYWHVPFTHCPTDEQRRIDLKCHCNPKDNFDWKGYSCTSRYFDINGLEKPAGYEEQQG